MWESNPQIHHALDVIALPVCVLGRALLKRLPRKQSDAKTFVKLNTSKGIRTPINWFGISHAAVAPET